MKITFQHSAECWNVRKPAIRLAGLAAAIARHGGKHGVKTGTPVAIPLWQDATGQAKSVIAVSETAGIIGSFFTISTIPTWYAGLVKPALNPPAWVFGPVWTTLFALMGIAAFLIWRMGWERKDVRMALGVFGIQLFLNAIWSIIFFGLQSPGWALIDITALWLAIVWTMVVFYKISKPAAYLLVSYILWVSFASYLNYSIWMLN